MPHFLDPVVLVNSLGLIGVVAIIFAESGLLIGFFLPGDSLLFTAGFLASQGFISIEALVVLTFLAAVFGDNIGYAFGKRIGPKIFTKEDSFFFHKKHLVRTERFYERYGKKTIILARFMPVVRTFAPILAGVGRMPYRDFFYYNIVGAGIWTLGLNLLGYYLGSLIPHVDRYLVPILLAIVLTSFIPPVLHFLRERKEKNKQTNNGLKEKDSSIF